MDAQMHKGSRYMHTHTHTHTHWPGLVAGLGVGTATEVAKRSLGVADTPSQVAGNPLLTEANIERIVNTLCTVRGAALKIGQMISLQGERPLCACSIIIH